MKFKVCLAWVFTWAWFIGAPLIFVGCTGGCSSFSANTYNASTVTHVAVTSGIRAWDTYVQQKQIEIRELESTDLKKAQKIYDTTTNQIAQVKSAYEKYQAAQIALLTTSEEFGKLTAAQDPNAPAAEDKLIIATRAATKTLSEVLNLLSKFGIKISN